MSTRTQPEGGRRHGGRGGGIAVLLIVVGVLILLGNFGWLSWNVLVRLATLWPVLLVALGVDLLTRRRYQLAVWGGAIVVGALLFAYDGGVPGSTLIWGTPEGELHTVSHALAGARAADVTINATVGALRLGDLANSTALVQGTVQTGRGETLTDDLTHRGGTAVLRLISDQRPGANLVGSDRRAWDLRLSDSVPIALAVKTGVGSANLDLQGAHLSSLRMEAGVGEVTATLPASGSYRADFKAGVGSTHITIPAALAARVTVKSGLGSVHVNGTFDRSGDTYETPGYASANDRVDLHVEGGLGQITVDR